MGRSGITSHMLQTVSLTHTLTACQQRNSHHCAYWPSASQPAFNKHRQTFADTHPRTPASGCQHGTARQMLLLQVNQRFIPCASRAHNTLSTQYVRLLAYSWHQVHATPANSTEEPRTTQSLLLILGAKGQGACVLHSLSVCPFSSLCIANGSLKIHSLAASLAAEQLSIKIGLVLSHSSHP